MKICLLCDEYPPVPQGGIGSFVQDLARGLAWRGHQVVVVGIYPHHWAREEYDEGVRVLRIAESPFKGRIGFLLDRFRLGNAASRLRRRVGLDLVEAPDTGGWGVAMPPNFPLVIRLHSSIRIGESMGWRSARGGLMTLAEDLALRRASQVVAVSQWMADRAPIDYPRAKLNPDRIEVVNNGVDTEVFGEKPYDMRVPSRLVFVGTLKPQKGLVPLLTAFRRIVRKRPELELVVAGKDTRVGDQSYRSIAIEESGLSEEDLRQIRWLGPVPREEVPDLFASASVCVFPSLAESFGLVAAEAMSCGRPVVYSKNTAGPELIEGGVDGILIDPQIPSEIEVAIVDLISNPETAGSIGVRAARRVREMFSLDGCVDATIALYRGVLNRQVEIDLGDHDA